MIFDIGLKIYGYLININTRKSFACNAISISEISSTSTIVRIGIGIIVAIWVVVGVIVVVVVVGRVVDTLPECARIP